MAERDTRIEALRQEVAELRAEVRRMGGGDGSTSPCERISRGHLLRSAGVVAAGVAAAAAAGSGALPALAANGDTVMAGQNTAATAVTGISGSVLSDAALRVSNYYTGSFDDYSDALQGYTFGAGLAALYGRNDAAGGAGVIGYSGGGYGGSFSGGLAPLRLQPAATAGAPTTVNHQQGELYVDSAGVLWICTASGTSSTPGTFKQAGTGGSALQVIQDMTLTSDQAAVTFVGIPQSYHDLRLVVTGLIDAAPYPRGDCGVRFNGDGGSNYSRAFTFNGTDGYTGTQYDVS